MKHLLFQYMCLFSHSTLARAMYLTYVRHSKLLWRSIRIERSLWRQAVVGTQMVSRSCTLAQTFRHGNVPNMSPCRPPAYDMSNSMGACDALVTLQNLVTCEQMALGILLYAPSYGLIGRIMAIQWPINHLIYTWESVSSHTYRPPGPSLSPH